MTVKVSEVYRTVQGEGAHTGRTAVFVRLAGCNLWNGRDTGRDRPACAAWCDVVPLEQQVPGEAGRTSFASKVGPHGGTYSPQGLADVIRHVWLDGHARNVVPGEPFVVLTGGEPTLQMTREVMDALTGMDVAVETNGTTEVLMPPMWHICVSPKGAHKVVRLEGSELKLVYPQLEPEAQPEVWEQRARLHEVWFERYYLQPMEPLPGPGHDIQWRHNITAALTYVQAHPLWRLSLQTHKFLDIP